MLNGAVDSITSAMTALIILLLISSLAGTWMMSGIVPSMIYYGLELLNPHISCSCLYYMFNCFSGYLEVAGLQLQPLG